MNNNTCWHKNNVALCDNCFQERVLALLTQILNELKKVNS
jgi:hypothetical protein